MASLDPGILSEMEVALTAFVTVDIVISIMLRRYLAQRGFFWAGAITSYLYNTQIGALYLYMALHRQFLLVFDITELYEWLWPASLVFYFFMVFFHSWAFFGGTQR
ncbi:hypothetical protein [Pseudomonas entomophila]|uniref:hypothetical protein n=1 Tax=Pseudomonas entomophila TaxID=312306 RepID=UPI00200FE91B|nr:hypothetical protein [Pseudomonas entomophila]